MDLTAGAAGFGGQAGGAGGVGGTGGGGQGGGPAGSGGQPPDASGCGGDQSLTFAAVADTYLQNTPPNQTNGQAEFLQVLAFNAFAGNRALVRFEFESSLPAGAEILDAALVLRLVLHQPASHELGVYRLTRSWVEAEATWSKPATSGAWSTPGGDFASATATLAIDASFMVGGVVSWDVTSDVTAFFDGSLSNHGWLLKHANDTAMNGEALRFGARESTTASERPQLTISYRVCGG